MSNVIANKEISVAGRMFRTAKLRHEWCDFFAEPLDAIREMRSGRSVADLLTFVEDICDERKKYPFQMEMAALAVLPVTTYRKWWDEMGFKARNKVRKGQKSGVDFRIVQLDDDFAKGVESIYNETPVKQGRKFYHYGKGAAEIKEELSSFLDRCVIVGAYYENELVGFMKCFVGKNVLRTIHIIAKVSHRDKCVMDALIAKGVEICDQKQLQNFQYGSWTDGGIGDFRTKHGFARVEVPRYFAPLTLRGKFMLKFKLYRPIRQRLPDGWVGPLVGLRAKWNSIRYKPAKELVGG